MAGVAAAFWIVLADFLHRRPGVRRHFAVLAVVVVLAAGSVIYCGVRSGYFAERLPEENRLILFRDSFGSSLIPLLTEGYSRITILDTRYIIPDLLGNFAEFENADVLFLYSTSILNQSSTLR